MGGQEPSPPRALQTAETVLVLFLREKGRELPLCFLESSLGCVVQNGLTMGGRGEGRRAGRRLGQWVQGRGAQWPGVWWMDWMGSVAGWN